MVDTPENETEEAGQTPAAEIEASSPDAVVEGASTPDAADEDDRDPSEKARDEFLERFSDGSEDEPEPEPEPEAEAAAENAEEDPEGAEGDPKSERDEASEDDDHLIPEEEYKGLSPNVKKRIGRLGKKVKDLEADVETHRQQAEEREAPAQRFNDLQKFTKDNGISNDQFIGGMNVMAAVAKGDANAFLEAIQPYLDWAQQATGQVLPEDIQRQVDDGQMMPEAAAQLARAREAQRVAEQNAQRAEERTQAQTVEQQRNSYVLQLQRDISVAETEINTSDPDSALKAEAVKPVFLEMLKPYNDAGIQLTTEQVKSLVRNAYAATPMPKTPKPPLKETIPSPTVNQGKQGAPVNETAEDEFSRRFAEYQIGAS